MRSGPRWAGLLVLGLVAVYAAGALAIHPSLYPDPAGGFLVHRQMMAGGRWNHITEPRADDIAQDRSYFYAVWSPGQYAVPGWLVERGVPLGEALRVVCIGGSLVGLAGWLLLFRTLQFDWSTVAASAVLMTASRSVNLSFLVYVGSDLLAFAAFPWLAVAAYRVRRSWALVPVAPVLVLAGFFFKNSLAFHVGAWVVGVLAAEVARGVVPRRREAARVVATGSGMLVAALLLQGAYLSRGWTPISYEPKWSDAIARYVLPASMPLMAATSLDDVLSRVFLRPGRTVFDYHHAAWFLLPLAAASLAFCATELRSGTRHPAAPALVASAGLVVGAFTILYASGSGASLHLSRHYLIPGLLLLPLLVRRIAHLRTPGLRRAALMALAVPCVYGVLSFGSNWQRHYQQRMVRSDDLKITHLMLTPGVLGFVQFLDRALPGGTTLMVTPSHPYALEFSRTRVLATSVTADSLEKIAATRWHGTVGNLVVMAERGMAEGSIAAWLASFESYDPTSWAYLEVDGFRFYVPSSQAVDRAWLDAAWTRASHGGSGAS